MTNLEIIETARVMHGVPVNLEVDTYAGWKRHGYIVKRGEKALFSTKIWKPCKVKPKGADDNDEVKETKNGTRMYLVPASFFSNEQVEELPDET